MTHPARLATLRQKDFYSVDELAPLQLPDLPRAKRSLEDHARRFWRSKPGLVRIAPRKTRPAFEYHVSLLPEAAQLRLALLSQSFANDDVDHKAEERRHLWERFEALPLHQQHVCENRLQALVYFHQLVDEGVRTKAATAMVCQRASILPSTLYQWRRMVDGHQRADWLAALAPAWRREGVTANCHPDAWETLKSDFLRSEKPGFSACYRRVIKLADKKGWAPIPSERTLRRRLDQEVPASVQTLAREGRDRLKALYPPQRRSRADLTAMQAVNMDGHRFDVFIRLEDGSITRLYLITLQDLYSGKILAWRLSESENKETVRLAIGDMVERYGIPDRITLDNGRAFTSKWISGGAAHRYRFKIRDEDPSGLLTTLGIELSFAKPYSGQSKPIERAFRDLAEEIARHPLCAGAYTGNRPEAKPANYGERAVPITEFKAHVDREIAGHNARAGRRGGSCHGRSFDQTFADSLADPGTVVRKASSAQRALWLLASEAYRARRPNGEIHLHGNRFWAPELVAYAGQKIVIRFDPDHLQRDLRVYDLSNRLICEARCIEDSGFYDADAARAHAKARGDYQKAVQAERLAHQRLTAGQLADLYAQIDAPDGTPKATTKVVRLALPGRKAGQADGNAETPGRPAGSLIDNRTFETSFSRALDRLAGEPATIDFPKGDRRRL